MSDATEMLVGTGDVFGAPAPRAVRGGGKGRSYIDPAGIRRDRWDRPVLPDPVTGEERSWTAVTTLARTMADVYNLGQWQQRMVARGMGIRHDLAALAASTEVDDKATLQSIASQAMEAAGSSTGRNTGSALHELTATFDRMDTAGRTDLVRRARPDLAADVKAYAQAMDALRLEVRPELCERMTVCRQVESAGTFDRLVMCPDGVWRIADLKTGQRADEYGYYELAQQLAVYANGEALWRVINGETGEGVWEALPGEIDTSVGLLIWLPAGRAHCEIRPVDLTEGMREARRSYETRERRKAAKKWVGAPYQPASALVAATAEECASVGTVLDMLPPGTDIPEPLDATAVVPDVAGKCAICSAAIGCDSGWLCEPCKVTSAAGVVREDPSDTEARAALDALLLKRIAGAPDVPGLMALARQHADVWTPDMQAAAAERWAALQV